MTVTIRTVEKRLVVFTNYTYPLPRTGDEVRVKSPSHGRVVGRVGRVEWLFTDAPPYAEATVWVEDWYHAT